MIHFFDITGLFLYMAFRIVIVPALLLLSVAWLLLLCIKTILKAGRYLRAIRLKPVEPRFRFLRFRFHLSK